MRWRRCRRSACRARSASTGTSPCSAVASRAPIIERPALRVIARIAGRSVLVVGALALAGCGASGYGHDVKGFTQQSKTPADQAVLRSIATYRTTSDDKLACSLVTPHFLTLRFDGKPGVCEAIARHQNKHELPKS